MSTETEASPSVVSGGTQETYLSPVGRRIAEILLRYLNEVKEAVEIRPFISRIVAEDEKGNVPIWNEEGFSNEDDVTPDPNSAYLCDICGHLTKGREGKLLNDGLFVCNWCRHAEMNFDVIPKEGENDIT